MRRAMLAGLFGLVLLAGLAMGGRPTAAAITAYTDRPTFDAAVGPTTVEDFTSDAHFPISTGVLNAATNLPGIGIVPGTIQAGVTYSTAIGTGLFFNIDAGGGYAGGFLDTVTGVGPVHVAFDTPASAFGFDANSLMGSSFDLTIHLSTGPDVVIGPTALGALSFFGYQSDAANITGVDVLGADRQTFSFAFDNFTFTANAAVTTPEPASLALLGAGLAGLGFARRRRG